MKTALCGLLALLAMCLAPRFAAAADFSITNLKYGIVCGPPEYRRVCYEKSDIEITNDSTCVYNRHPEPCTWYGYSFDYSQISQDTFLDCEWSADTLVTLGNPDKVQSRGVSFVRFQLPLVKGKTHFFNPVYATAPDASKKSSDKHETVRCSHAGQKLFDIHFTLRFPSP
jgi:hypothetical protein